VNFDKNSPGRPAQHNSATEGNSYATSCSGIAFGSDGREHVRSNISEHYGGYERLADVSSKFTLNYGLRVEHEDGIRELNNNFTVGFDSKASSPLTSVVIPAASTPSGGTAARTVTGGLMYAGCQRQRHSTGQPAEGQVVAPYRRVYSINTSTVLRGGYGLYWSPWNYPVPSSATSNYGQIGFTNNTVSPQTAGTPTVTLVEPVPTGLSAPSGNSLGALRASGTSISYVDQGRTALACSSIRSICNASCPTRWPSPSATSARAETTCRSAGRSTPREHQPARSEVCRARYRGAQPAGPQSVLRRRRRRFPVSSATLSRAQLLRPFPQFLNINDRQVSEGVNRYNAFVAEWSKRPSRAASAAAPATPTAC